MERKNISDLIKAGQDRLNETPSRHAWKKLENRLDARKNKHQSTLYRQIAMIAAVVALVAVVALLSIVQQENPQYMANAEPVANGFQLEPLEGFTDVDTRRSYQIAALQKNYHGKSTTVINEGPRGKQLVPAPKFVSNQQSGYFASKFEQPRAKKNPQAFAENLAEKALSLDGAIASSTEGVAPQLERLPLPASAEAMSKESEIVSYTYSSEVAEDAEVIAPTSLSASDITPPTASPDIKKDLYDQEIAYNSQQTISTNKDRRLEAQIEEADFLKAQTQPYKKKQDSAGRAKKAKTLASGKAEVFQNLNAHTNSISIDYPEQNNLSLFKWLVGQWQGTASNGLSIEQWQFKDEFTIEGKGFIVINGDTTFTEGMRIQKIDQDLYYILSLDQSQKPVRFRLKSYQNQQAIFENSALAFPNQIILQQNNQNNFSTILQNSAPTQIQSAQESYISNRNAIQKEQATRNLSRVKN